MSRSIATTSLAVLLALGGSLLAAPLPAQAQSESVRCKVKPDFPSTWCCRTCVAWNKGQRQIRLALGSDCATSQWLGRASYTRDKLAGLST
jgi:hypothetical protein